MTPWDELLGVLDQLIASDQAPHRDTEVRLTALVEQAMSDGTVDRELHAADTARWLVGLASAYRTVRERHPQVDPELDAADLRLLVTRWLHPARPRVWGARVDQ